MESELLQLIVIFVVGLICGALIMLLWNKLSSGSASPSAALADESQAQVKIEKKEQPESVEEQLESVEQKVEPVDAAEVQKSAEEPGQAIENEAEGLKKSGKQA